jgi:branched-chain amino acid transport system ATP-binding protein
MLEVTGLTVGYGSAAAVSDIDLHIGSGEIVALVGHNGAGKTTLLRAISGLLPSKRGEVFLDGRSLRKSRPSDIAQKDLAYVPQGRNVFSDLSVEDNLRIARDAANNKGLPPDAIFEIFPILEERRAQRAGSLSGGQQQMLALSLALSRGPRLIMLDEPSTGLSPLLVQTVFSTIRKLHAGLGTSFLVIDQNIEQLLDLAGRAYVMKAGRIVYEGSASSLTESNLWQYF